MAVGMNEFSAKFAATFFSRWPAWRDFAQVISDDEGVGYLSVEIPNPTAPDRTLAISTADDQVTVSLDSWHAHYYPFSDVPDEAGIRDACAVIEGLLAESLVVVVTRTDGNFRSSKIFPTDELSALSRTLAEGYVISWKSTFDRAIREA